MPDREIVSPSAAALVGAPTVVAPVTDAYEQAAAAQRDPEYVLVLYVAGTAPRSLRAIKIARRLCDELLAGRHDLEVVDIYQQPDLAEQDGVLAVPVLVRKEPLPEVKLIGDLTDYDSVLRGLGLARGS